MQGFSWEQLQWLREQNFNFDWRIVGGWVRDLFREKVNFDLDLASPCPPDLVATELRNKNFKLQLQGFAHGSVGTSFRLNDITHNLTITTLRRDLLTDGRHSIVAFAADWLEDSKRRDFTCNALAMDQIGQIFDYHQGLADLKSGIIRFIGDPTTRIEEDFLRILRYFRFWTVLGQQDPPLELLNIIKTKVYGLNKISQERIWQEYKLMLASDNFNQALPWLEQANLFGSLGIITKDLSNYPELDYFRKFLILTNGQKEFPFSASEKKRWVNWRHGIFQDETLELVLDYCALIKNCSLAKRWPCPLKSNDFPGVTGRKLGELLKQAKAKWFFSNLTKEDIIKELTLCKRN